MRFEKWLGQLLGQNQQEIRRLMRDKTALQFLIVWSLFESKCFQGFVKIDVIDSFSQRVIQQDFDPTVIAPALSHFHCRYQDKNHYQHLMHGQVAKRMDALLQTEIGSFSADDQVFFVTLVAYRYRNNMFHGNKGVDTWLQYREQIELCTSAMEHFVTHAETLFPTLVEEKAA
jgi:hypothetical protein